MLVRSNVVGIIFTALALAINEVMLVRSNVVGIIFTALALTVNKVMLVRSNVVGINFTALALTVNEGVLMGLFTAVTGEFINYAARSEHTNYAQAKHKTKN